MTVSDLPALNATLNATCFVLLTIGYMLIRRGRVAQHRAVMIAAFCTSVVFLISYLIYHAQIGSKHFPGQGPIRYVYFTILLTHTVLAAVIVPMVLITLSRGLKRRDDRHRAIARWTLPFWMYVSVTGVIVYLMLYRLYFSVATMSCVFAQGSPQVGLDPTSINPQGPAGGRNGRHRHAAPPPVHLPPAHLHPLVDVGLVRALGRVDAQRGAAPRATSSTRWRSGWRSFFASSPDSLFVVATDAYRRAPRLRRLYLVPLLPVAIWFTLAPAALGTDLGLRAGVHPGRRQHGRRRGRAPDAGAGGAPAGRGRGRRHAARLRRRSTRGSRPCRRLPAGQSLMLILVIFLLAALGMQLMTFEDMTFELRQTNRRLESAQSELRQAVITDALTGMRNRRFFDEVIGRELQRHRRYRTPLSIVFIDVDHFKMINDTLGHDTGDRVLREVATFLLRHIREADYVFRWGGDEFLVLISCGEQEAVRRARELQDAFAGSKQLADLPPGVGLSIGCVEVPVDTSDIMPLRPDGGRADVWGQEAETLTEGRAHGRKAASIRDARASPSGPITDTANTSRAAAASALPPRPNDAAIDGGIVAGLDPGHRLA